MIEKDELLDVLQEQFDDLECIIYKLKCISSAVHGSDDVSEEGYEIDKVIEKLADVFDSIDGLILDVED